MSEDTNTWHIYTQPPAAGSWVMNGNFKITVEKRPCWFHKKMTKLLLGWEWQDE